MDNPSRTALDYDDRLLEHLSLLYGSEVDDLLSSLVRPPSRLYVRVNTLRVSRDELLDLFKREGVEAYPDELLDDAIYLPIKGPFKVTRVDKTVVADKRAAESVMLGANLYAPGVLRLPEGLKEGDEVNVVAPSGLVVGYGYARKPKGGRGVVVEVVESLYRAPKTRELPGWAEGYFYEQGLPSMVASRLLGPEPGDLVVDMCAAPGGKATHIAQLCGNACDVLAFDISGAKLLKLASTVSRLGTSAVVAWKADSRYLDLELDRLVGRVDKIMLDPPCTNLGVRPKVYDRRRWSDVLNCARYQEQFIKVAAKLLRKGGLLVYSTCTLTSAENEELVDKAVEAYGFEVLSPEERTPWGRGRNGACKDAVLRFEPHLHNTPGHFIAVLKKL